MEITCQMRRGVGERWMEITCHIVERCAHATSMQGTTHSIRSMHAPHRQGERWMEMDGDHLPHRGEVCVERWMEMVVMGGDGHIASRVT
jgi:hypothetical protein